MDTTIARLFYRAARRAVMREAPAPQPKKKSRREETGRGFKLARSTLRLDKIKAIMDSLTADAVSTNNPFDASWQSVNGSGFDEDYGCNDCQSMNYSSLAL